MSVESFLTLEDINSTIYSNPTSYLHEIPIKDLGDDDFSNVHIDFCTVSRTANGSNYIIEVEVSNAYWNGEYYFKGVDGTVIQQGGYYNGKIILNRPYKEAILVLYINNLNTTFSAKLLTGIPVPFEIKHEATLENITHTDRYKVLRLSDNQEFNTATVYYDKGVFYWTWSGKKIYYLGKLIKTDFQFECNQSLTVGKVNKVRLNAGVKYLPSGALVGDNTPVIEVLYGDETIPVTYDSTLQDYVFDLDLSDKTTTGKVRFTVNVETNEVLNQTSTEVRLDSEFETINTLSDFTSFIGNGGIGRLGANITLTSPITVNKDCYIIGNDKTITMSGNQFVIGTDKTFKAENTVFSGGLNAIHQKTGTKVELTDCTFTDCTGTGSAIECDIELHSLDNPTDFTTILNDCSFSNCDMCVLHGGDLTVQGCNVTGKIADSNYPYFLYQTDGNATLLGNNFQISSNSTIETDIEFNSCIFICGETAQVNGLSHTELQNNNLSAFLNVPQNNQSSIDLTYYYNLIEDNITLQSSKGYCHSVSGVDYVFKTNVNIERSD